MPRRGWSGYQVIRCPHPKSEDWRRAHKISWWRSAHWQWPPATQVRASTAASSPTMARWAVRLYPTKSRRSGGQCKVASGAVAEWESAIAEGLVAALQQAQREVQTRPLAAQFEECQAFIKRSQNKLSRLEQERIAEQEALDAGLARFQESVKRCSQQRMLFLSPFRTGPRTLGTIYIVSVSVNVKI